jgi:DNA-binding NtrC family response regulator
MPMCVLGCRGALDIGSSKRIVGVVDDEIDITTLFHDVLCENVLDASVYAFNDPVAALKHFTENKSDYALIISDLRMPGLNGLELLKKVKGDKPKVRTILMSAYNLEDYPTYQKYMKEGVIDSTIEKPVTINRLCQRVKDELNAYEPKIENKK